MLSESLSSWSEEESWSSSSCYRDKDMANYVPAGSVLASSCTKDKIVDTGLRFQARGGIALYGLNGFEVIGFTCVGCQSPALDIKPWSSCAECGEQLLEWLPGPVPPREYTRDRVSGSIRETTPATTPAPTANTSCPSLEDLSITEGSDSCAPAGDKKPSRSWASRGRGRGLRHAASLPEFVPAPSEAAALAATAALPPKEKEEAPSGCPVPAKSSANTSSTTGERKGLTGEGSVISPVPTAVPEGSSSPKGGQPDSRFTLFNDHLNPRWSQPPKELEMESEFEDKAQRKIMNASGATGHVLDSKLLQRAKNSCVLPGLGDPRVLTKLARVQRLLNKRVAHDYGLIYPYVPKDVMAEIEENRGKWAQDDVWEYLGVPVPLRKRGLSDKYDLRFEGCLEHWNYGRHIYSDRVIFRRPGRRDLVYYVHSTDEDGKTVQLPDPFFYT